MSIPSSIAFAVGDGFEAGRPVKERARAAAEILLALGLISDTTPISLGFARPRKYPVGARFTDAPALEYVSVMHEDDSRPFPVMTDTHADFDAYPKATLLIVFHHFYPAPYEPFVDELQKAFGGQLEEHIVVF